LNKFANFGNDILRNLKRKVINMTSKELLYVEDALGHEKFMKCCAQNTATQLTDQKLVSYMTELQVKHTDLLNKFKNLL